MTSSKRAAALLPMGFAIASLASPLCLDWAGAQSPPAAPPNTPPAPVIAPATVAPAPAPVTPVAPASPPASVPAPVAPVPAAEAPNVLQEAGKVLESARRQHEDTMRTVMKRHGIEDSALQDTLIAFLTEQSVARQPVREQAQVVRDSMRSIVLSDEQVRGLMTDFRALVAQEKARYQAALAHLDERLGFSRSPRLEAALTFVGVIGDEAMFLGGPASFADFGSPTPGAMGVMTGSGSNAGGGPSIMTPIIMQPIITPPIITAVITPGNNAAPATPPATAPPATTAPAATAPAATAPAATAPATPPK